MPSRIVLASAAAAAAAVLLAGCTASAASEPRATVTATATITAEPSPTPTVTVVATPFARPAWLGTRALPKNDNDLADPGETPAELVDRRLEPRPSALADPDSDAWFASVTAIPDDVLARSSWSAECPVTPDQLAYVVMPFWGFDLKPHTGEMLTSAAHADAIVTVFEQMYERRFPIEEMRVTTAEEVNGAHYGDQNVTISFECRKVTGGFDRWSQHASGLALDINPFHNPWRRDGYVFPELADAYLDRDWLRPGMIETQTQTIADFDAIGWAWGGSWTDLDDWMHFSANDL
ncbi:M15 family metallopeptidase [Demequina sp.]|uniref:M15 family metallopeptidase n=1 Tax=Demequina sp. TaxID=2050685 RepID=UPI0025DD3483|nr:M15 family metallopeptidase [Demequina sp.]